MVEKIKIMSLGNNAVLLQLGTVINEKMNERTIALADFLTKNPFDGFIEAVPAYASITVFYVLSPVNRYEKIRLYLEEKYLIFEKEFIIKNTDNEAITIKIPVVYQGEDLSYLADVHGLSEAEIIEIHSSVIYRVYMLGFLPGFAYLGGLDSRIATPRRASPRLRVPTGSVGIAGHQTGVYPSASPGGWQLIGHTDLRLFDRHASQNSLLQPGDMVQFVSIL